MTTTAASGTAPACPRAGHTVADGFRVSRDGRYGHSPDAQRQRYRCTAPDGAFHRFTPTLPRQVSHGDTCPECEAHVGAHAGPVAPRAYRHRLSLVAEALVAVGRGVSYQTASQRARVAAGRELLAGDGTGGLVAEWVDVWAPLVLSTLAEPEPAETLAIGTTDVRWTNSRTGQRRRQFALLVAYGYGPDGSGRFRAARVSATVQTLDYLRLLADAHLSRPPRTVLADDPSATAAVSRRWSGEVSDERSFRDAGDDPAATAPLVLPTSSRPDVCRDLDEALDRLSAVLARRSFALRNARRTTLLLGLARLHLEGRDDVAAYQRILRGYAEENGGAAPVAQRTGHDRYDGSAHRTVSSLRVPRGTAAVRVRPALSSRT